MTITQLEYIIAVDTYRHFATAAERCFVTQPTLSMQIQKLEDDLGTKIFDRSKQPVIPTETGQEIIAQARIVVHETRMIYQLIKDKQGLMQGELKVGIIPTLAPYLLPSFLHPFVVKYPDVKIKFREMNKDIIIDQLKSGRIDAAILVTPLHENSIMEYPLFYEELVAFVSKDNTAYTKSNLLPADIELKELWLLQEGHCFRNQVLNLCEIKMQPNQESHFEYEAGNIDTLRKMVEINNGVTILPELATLDFNVKQQTMVRRFKAPVPVREVSLVTHRNFVKKKLVDVLKQEILISLPKKITLNKKSNIIKT